MRFAAGIVCPSAKIREKHPDAITTVGLVPQERLSKESRLSGLRKVLADVITKPLFGAPWEVVKMKTPSAAEGSSRVKSCMILAAVAAWVPSPEALRTMILARGTPKVSSLSAM